MADFKVFETRRFLDDLQPDFSGQQDRIRRKLGAYVYPQLRRHPYAGKNIKQLRDYAPPTWRYRIGDYRFFYTIDERSRTVCMVTVDHRGRAYD